MFKVLSETYKTILYIQNSFRHGMWLAFVEKKSFRRRCRVKSVKHHQAYSAILHSKKKT